MARYAFGPTASAYDLKSKRMSFGIMCIAVKSGLPTTWCTSLAGTMKVSPALSS